jgi:hypothetical protein
MEILSINSPIDIGTVTLRSGDRVGFIDQIPASEADFTLATCHPANSSSECQIQSFTSHL